MIAAQTRHFVLGAVFDFVLYCFNREMPMVVGGSYPRDKFIDEFEKWATDRGLPLDKIDRDAFQAACNHKLLG
jgi:hypothetical protein